MHSAGAAVATPRATTRSAEAADAAEQPKFGERTLSSPVLFGQVRARTSKYLLSELDRLFQMASDELLANARDADSDDSQQSYFDAMEGVHRVSDTIKEVFSADIDGKFELLWSAEVASIHAEDDASLPEDLSLVDTQSIDDGIRIMEIITQATPALRTNEFELSARLGALLNLDVDDETNPVTARTIGLAFHESMQNLGADAPTRRALYVAFNQTIIAGLGGLQEDLNNLLMAQGILAKVPRKIVSTVSGRTPPDSESSKASTAPESGHWVQPAGASGGTPFPGLPVASAVYALNFLDRALTRGDQSLAVPPAIESKTTVREIVELALRDLQTTGAALTWGDTGRFALARRVDDALAEHSIKLSDVAMVDGIDLVSKLYDALLTDPLVESWAKRYMRRLAIPVLRLALRDGSFFASESHPARSVLNELAVLKLDTIDGNAGVAELAMMVEQTIEAQLSAQPSNESFTASDQQLSKIRARQSSLREQSARDYLQGRAEELAAVIFEDTDAESTPASASRIASAESRAGVQQLSEGDVVIIGEQAEVQHPAILVSGDPAGRFYLFADRSGGRTWGFSTDGLALALEDEFVTLAEIGCLAAVDRAMCDVLYKMHLRLELKAMTDTTTGVANCKRIMQELLRWIERKVSDGRAHHLVHFQVHSLGEIEFQCGPRAVEGLLKQYAAVLKRQIGGDAVLAHTSKGEFTALLPNSARGDVNSMLERHLRAVKAARCTYKGNDLPLNVGVGALALGPAARDPAEALLKVKAVCQTKEQDRKSTLNFPREAWGGVTTLPRYEVQKQTFRELVQDGQLGLRCQRIEPLKSDALPYYEVLLGVSQNGKGLGPPGNVVSLAEVSGEVVELDKWVLTETIAWMHDHTDALRMLDGISVNLSGRTIVEPGMADFVVSTLDEYPNSEGKLIFEITESAAIQDMSIALQFITALKERGCRFALDDFGSGHASFSYLKLLPVDAVKIDGLFIRELLSNRADEAMVRSIREVAALLNMKTVAEFVEDEEVVGRLRDIGIDYAQGYAIARPGLLADLSR